MSIVVNVYPQHDGKTRIVATVGPFLLNVDVSMDVFKLRLSPIKLMKGKAPLVQIRRVRG